MDDFIRTKPRGHGKDPIQDTYLDKTVAEVVEPLEDPVEKLGRLVKQEEVTVAQVAHVAKQITKERGKLKPGTGPDLYKSFGLND